MNLGAVSRRRFGHFWKFGRVNGEKRRLLLTREGIFRSGDPEQARGTAIGARMKGMMIIPFDPCGPFVAGAGGLGGD
jgi:hypothetical protein